MGVVLVPFLRTLNRNFLNVYFTFEIIDLSASLTFYGSVYLIFLDLMLFTNAMRSFSSAFLKLVSF